MWYYAGMDELTMRARQDALAFLTRHKTGVLATSERDYQVHASLINYTADEDFNIYFITRSDMRKFKALSAHPQVAFTVATTDVPQTLQIEGMAMDISLDPEASKKKEALFATLNSNEMFYAPLAKLDLGELVLVWIRPTWIRWADYAFEESGDRHIFKEIPVTS